MSPDDQTIPKAQRLPAREEEQEPLRQGQILGRYVVVEHIGGGGGGQVYSAYDQTLQRQVALKVANVPDAPGDGSLNEARSLARLSHPNVVAVHDVFREEGVVVIAMELIVGVTLAQWFGAAPRSVADVLRVFGAAGRGLLAAHQAGMVHGDFKPSNVMVSDDDGRALVVDFGVTGIISKLSASTQRGLVGTPAYMAPEQLEGHAANVRSDIYTFCLCLCTAIQKQSLSSAPDRDPRCPAGVPRPLWRKLVQGLDPDPQRRPGSLQAILSEIDRAARPRHRAKMATLVALVLLTIAGVTAFWPRSAERSCQTRDSRLAKLFDADRQRSLRKALLSSSLPYATFAWRAVEADVQGYLRDWHKASVELCHAADRGDSSDRIAFARRQCLDARLDDLSEALTTLERLPPIQAVKRSFDILAELPSVDRCADVATLSRVAPTGSAARRGVDAARAAIRRGRSQLRQGEIDAAERRARYALSSANQVDHAPAQAEAHYLIGRVHDRRGEMAHAEKSFRQAITHAQAGRHDRVEASAWIALVQMLTRQPGRRDDASEYFQFAQATCSRIDDPRLRSDLLAAMGELELAQGSPAAAIEHYEAALGAVSNHSGAQHRETALALASLGGALVAGGRYHDAIAPLTEARELGHRHFGPTSPMALAIEEHLAAACTGVGRHDEARQGFERVLRARAPGSARRALAVEGVATVLRAQGQPEKALALLRSEQEALAVEGPSKLRSTVQAELCSSYYALQRLDEAAHACRLACEAAGSDPSRQLLKALTRSSIVARGRGQDPIPGAEQAVSVAESVFGHESAWLCAPLGRLGDLYLTAGRPQDAVTALDRALPRCREAPTSTRFWYVFRLAAALDQTGGEGTRIRALAREALAGLREDGQADSARVVDRWLESYLGESL